jgi:NAD+ kinase
LKKLSVLERAKRGLLGVNGNLIRHDGSHVRAHEENEEAQKNIEGVIRSHQLEVRGVEDLKKEDLEWADLVISIGGDGTFMKAARTFGEKTDAILLGINSSPTLSLGFFCSYHSRDFKDALPLLLEGKYTIQEFWRLRTLINGKQIPEMAINDVLYANPKVMATTRYRLTADGASQLQQSSGIWISTSSGSTAAIKSAGGFIQPLTDRRLQYRVRELFLPYTINVHPDVEPKVGGFLSQDFSITNKLDQAMVYFDGFWEGKPIAFGDQLTFKPCETPLQWIAPNDFDKRRSELWVKSIKEPLIRRD